MTNYHPSIPLLLDTLFLWKPQHSRSAFVLIWLIRIITFSLFFRSFVGPSILRLLSSRLRVQSVSLRSIRGIYFRAGKAILHVERVGLAYHRPSSAGASRFSICVEGVRVEVTKAEGTVAVHLRRKRVPRLADLAPFPLAAHAWGAVRATGIWIYASCEPFVRPVIRTLIVSLLRTAIRALPALTQVLDLEVDSAVVTLQSIPGAELVVHNVNVHTSVAFTQLDNSANPTIAHQARHRRFASVADFGTRFKNSLRRSWGRAWGSTQVAASLSIRVHEVLGVASKPLLDELNISIANRHTFLVVPNVTFSTSVRLDPRQQIERHGLEANLASEAASVDIDVVQYILNLLKKQREQDDDDNTFNEGIPTPDTQSIVETPQSPPMQSPLLSPPVISPRFGWASPMSPNSPLMEVLSVRFRWRKHHPVRRIRGRESMTHFSALKAINIDLPGLTLIHRMPVSTEYRPETYKVTLEKIGFSLTLSHPDRIPLHRRWLGRTSAPGDPLTADVYAVKFSVNQAALDRVGSGTTVIDHLRVVSLGYTRVTVLISQWPSPWLGGPCFLSGDPNSQFVIADVSLGKLEITEHLEVIQKHLNRPRPAKSPKRTDSYSLPHVLAPVPRIVFGFHIQGISLRLISACLPEDEGAPFALEAHTDGFAVSASTHFQMLPDYRFAKLPTDPDRPRLQMQMYLQATLQRIFVNINHGNDCGDSEGALGLSVYPPEPVLSMESIQLSGGGHAFGEMADEVGGSVTVDAPSIFFNADCASDAVSIELWQPDAVAALRTILSTVRTTPEKSSREDSSSTPRYLLNSLPSGLSLSVAVARFMVFITEPDLTPEEDLNIYRGVASHMGIAFHYCSLRDKHNDGLQDLLSRRQKRLQLSLTTELLATAAGGSTAAALSQTEQVLMQVSMWGIALRDALSTRFVADDPYGVGDLSEDYRSQEYLRVEEVTANIVLAGQRPGGRPLPRSKDECDVSVIVTRVRGYFDLAHAYNLLLAIQAFKTLLPPQGPKTVSRRESTMSVTVRCSVDKTQLMWDFPLRMKLYSRISSFSIQRPASGSLRMKWSAIVLGVCLGVERDGVTEAEWQELLQLPDWSIDIKSDIEPVAIAAEGYSARLRIPFDYVLADLILDMNVTFKSLKHLVKMVPSGLFSNPSIPAPEEAKSMPNLHLRVGCLSAEAADEAFETRLGLIWKAGSEAARLRLERDDAFEAKATTIRAANQDDVSTPSREAQNEFQFTSEHTISVEEARSRLYQVHSGAWNSRFRQVHIQQVRREEEQTRNCTRKVPMSDSLDNDLIVMKPTPKVPPLLRVAFNDLSLHLTRPSFASNHLADFLYREGAGIPRDTEYSLLIPMHLNFSVSSCRVTCREYPLPMLNIPAHSIKDVPGLEFDSDLVIAEEMGTVHTVEWIDCAIVKPHTGVHGASPLCITVPKTINPVKTYANPTIRVKTDDVTDFAWGVSYGPATQDIMRVLDTLSHAPRDSSPPIGFWDKLRLVFHWRLKVLFDNEVHLHMKGSYDPQGLRGTGAGFALCWEGNPQLLINQPNAQNELIQVVSDSVLVMIPNIEASYGETSNMGSSGRGSRTPASSTGKSNRSRRVCAKFGSGSRFGVGIVLERTCGPDCPHCSGDAFHRQCRFFDFRPHHAVTLESKDHPPLEKTIQDSYNGFRSDFIHLSISLASSLNQNENEYSSIHLSSEVFAHFWAWWSLFDGKSLPIRQGQRYRHKRPLSPKFGQHLATIKYRIEVPRLFLSHLYTDESRDAWADGVTPFVGVKALTQYFQVDMHQRATETIITAPDGSRKVVIHKPFDAVEVVMKELDLRALLAVFDTPLKQAVQLDPTYLESTYRKRTDIPVVEPNSPWIDLDDFADTEWSPKDVPRLHMLPAASCPRFTYFKRATASTTENRVENSKFGSEKSHVCLLGKEASVPQVQIDIALNRIAELRNMTTNGKKPCISSSSLRQGSTDTNYMVSLLEDYVAHLRQVDAQSRTLPSNGSQYYMPVDFVSPEEWDDFDNVYQVHCPRIYLDNIIRDIMMQYYYCSRARRGAEYHMATRAVKFIRHQAEAVAERLQRDPPEHKERRGTAASATQAAAHAVRKMLGGDGLGSTSVETSPEPLFHTVDNKDPLKGWSKGVSLERGHFCLLVKPQLVLHSEKSAESVCVLAAVQGKLQTYNIMDDANADDPVSGKVMSRNFASLSGLQAFSPSEINTSGLGVVPLEVLLDLRCGSNYFDRLVPQTDATFHYDKFNRLRLRNEATSALTRKNDVDDQLHNHLHSQNDLVRIHVPHFTVSANDRHFQSISNIVTNLLLFSNVAHKTRAERLEKMLFSYDFTNLGSAADVVAKFQARLRMAVETKKEAENKLRSLGDDGQIEKFKIKAHILLLGEELDYVFEAIKLAQDKAAGQAAQKSALLLHASSTEISWRMIDRHDQLLAKLAVRDINFRWLNRQDSSTVNRLAFGDLQAFDGAADAEWTEILSKHDEPANHPLVKRKLFCLANWTVLPPVGGITIYESFELMLHPMRLQLDTRVGRRILEYVWPARRKRLPHRSVSTPETGDFHLPPSPSSPNTPRTPQHPQPTRRMSADMPSPKSTNSNRLGVPTLRKTATRSYSDLRKVSPDSLQVPGLPRTRSTDVLVSPAVSSSSGRVSGVSDDSRDRLPFRRDTDDATVMKTRSSQKTFVWVKVSSLHVLLSIMKEDSFLCRDARIQTRDLEYRNQTWSFEELVEQFIPSGRNWKGWVKMAFSQPLVPVLPVAKELISKTKWMNTKHQHDPSRRGTMTPRGMSFHTSSTSTANGKRLRTMSTFTLRDKVQEKAPIYKGDNLSSLGLITAEPESIPQEQEQAEGAASKSKNKLFKVFKRRRTESKTRDSFDSTESSRTTSTKSSWSPEADHPPETARPFVAHSNSDSTILHTESTSQCYN